MGTSIQSFAKNHAKAEVLNQDKARSLRAPIDFLLKRD